MSHQFPLTSHKRMLYKSRRVKGSTRMEETLGLVPGLGLRVLLESDLLAPGAVVSPCAFPLSLGGCSSKNKNVTARDCVLEE